MNNLILVPVIFVFVYVVILTFVLCLWLAEMVHLVISSNIAHRTVCLSSNKEKLDFFVTSIENILVGDTQKIEKIGVDRKPVLTVFYPFIAATQYFVSLQTQEKNGLPLEVDIITLRLLFYRFTKANFSDEKPSVFFHGFGHKSEIKRLKNAFKHAKKSFDDAIKKEQLEKFEKHFIDMYTDGL